MSVNKNSWFNTDPITPNHVLIMSCTYEGWCEKREIFKAFEDKIKPVRQWLHDHNMYNRCRFDYRAVKNPVDAEVRSSPRRAAFRKIRAHNVIEVKWYVLFDNKDDLVLYKLCQDGILNNVIDGIM